MNAILVIILIQYEWGTPDIVQTYKMCMNCSCIYMYNVLDINQIIPIRNNFPLDKQDWILKWTLLSLCRRPHSVSPSVRAHCVFHSVQRGDATRYSRRRNHVWTVPPSHLPQLLIQTRKQGKIIVFNAWKKYDMFVREACRLFHHDKIFVIPVYIQLFMWID